MNDVLEPRELHHEGVRRVRAELQSGRVDVLASPDGSTHAYLDGDLSNPDLVEFLERTVFDVRGDELVVQTPRTAMRGTPDLRLRIEVSEPVELRIETGSADLRIDTTVGDSRLSTGSGDIDVARVEGRLDARTGSGDISVESVREGTSLNTGSGDITVGTHEQAAACSTGSGDVSLGESVGPVKVKVGSGDITIERVRNHSVATSGSGDVRVEAAEGPSVVAESARGDVHIGVPAGTPTYLDLKTVTGDIRCDLEPSERPADGQPSLALRARTVTGDITVVRV
jgi:DUF4097 and DUF4098 domain-containing protein YvlB